MELIVARGDRKLNLLGVVGIGKGRSGPALVVLALPYPQGSEAKEDIH